MLDAKEKLMGFTRREISKWQFIGNVISIGAMSKYIITPIDISNEVIMEFDTTVPSLDGQYCIYFKVILKEESVTLKLDVERYFEMLFTKSWDTTLSLAMSDIFDISRFISHHIRRFSKLEENTDISELRKELIEEFDKALIRETRTDEILGDNDGWNS